MKKLFLTLFLLAAAATQVQAATYYVRTDGGTTAQCNGTVDAPVPTTTSNIVQGCAVNHPFWVLSPIGNNPNKMIGGDTMIIGPGSYKIGLGAPNTSDTSLCYANWPWTCNMRPIPSGTAANPTRILGKGWDTGCATKPKLWGTERNDTVLNLKGSSNIEVQCLDITDNSDCSQNSNAPNACNRSTMPYGQWATTGITAWDSTNVLIKNVSIHGLYRAVWAGRLKDWTIEDSDLSKNDFVGWDGDIGADVSSNSGKIIFRRSKINFSGCGEKLDGTPFNCISQSQGGYGDALGTHKTSGDWIFDQVEMLYNVSDGIDLLYHDGTGKITITNSKLEGNTGNQVKVAAPTTITNTTMRGTCNYFQNNVMAMQTWNGKAFDNCRAGGDVIAAAFRPGMKVDIVNSKFQDVRNIAIMTSGTACNGTEAMTADAATTFELKPKFFDPSSTSVKYYASGAGGNGDGPCGTLKLTVGTGTTPPACVPDNSCANLTAACGQTKTCTDNCGTVFTKTGPPCCVSNGSCSATPACGQTATGVDNCNQPCTRTGAPCCVPNGSCIVTANALPACGGTVTGKDNCGADCTLFAPDCPPVVICPPPVVCPTCPTCPAPTVCAAPTVTKTVTTINSNGKTYTVTR